MLFLSQNRGPISFELDHMFRQSSRNQSAGKSFSSCINSRLRRYNTNLYLVPGQGGLEKEEMANKLAYKGLEMFEEVSVERVYVWIFSWILSKFEKVNWNSKNLAVYSSWMVHNLTRILTRYCTFWQVRSPAPGLLQQLLWYRRIRCGATTFIRMPRTSYQPQWPCLQIIVLWEDKRKEWGSLLITSAADAYPLRRRRLLSALFVSARLWLGKYIWCLAPHFWSAWRSYHLLISRI